MNLQVSMLHPAACSCLLCTAAHADTTDQTAESMIFLHLSVVVLTRSTIYVKDILHIAGPPAVVQQQQQQQQWRHHTVACWQQQQHNLQHVALQQGRSTFRCFSAALFSSTATKQSCNQQQPLAFTASLQQQQRQLVLHHWQQQQQQQMQWLQVRGVKLRPYALAPKPLPRYRKPSKDGRMNRMVIRVPPQVQLELQGDRLTFSGEQQQQQQQLQCWSSSSSSSRRSVGAGTAAAAASVLEQGQQLQQQQQQCWSSSSSSRSSVGAETTSAAAAAAPAVL
jgi:hypothetical protein